MKVRGQPLDEAQAVLGTGAEQEVTFLIVPMTTYALVAEQAKKEQCTAAQLFERAISQYIRNANAPVREQAIPARTPDIVVRKRRK